MYEAPIHLYWQQINSQIEDEILTAVRKLYLDVNKEELLRALQYDRGQYDEGYRDGLLDGENKIVRCKDCKDWGRNCGFVDSPNGHCFCHDIETNGHDFCSYGERREGE